MNTSTLLLPVLLALAAPAAQAQDPTACPQLPDGTELTWEHRGSAGSDFCRALRADGSEAFGLYIAAESPFEPKRRNREEQAMLDGHEIHWYRAELAAQPDIEARETLVTLNDGRVAHIWLQAHSEDALRAMFQVASELRFTPARLGGPATAGP